MRRILAILFALALLCGLSEAGQALAEAQAMQSGDFRYAIHPDGTAEITGYAAEAEALVIPQALDGHPVTAIGAEAFSGCGGLTSLTMPEGLQAIGDYAFSGCGLTSLTLPEGLQSIGDYAFSFCESLTSLTLPNTLQSIGYGAFDGCSNLVLTVPQGSCAEGWAREQNMRYVYPGGAK